MKILKHYIVLGSILIFGCADLVEVTPPKNLLLTSSTFSNNESAIAAMVGIYVRMMDNFSDYYIPLATGYAGDELNTYTLQAPLLELYKSFQTPGTAFSNTFWNNGFFYIYQSNSVIEGCEESTGISNDVKQQLVAEAKFVRSLWLYYLTNMYGDIPMPLTTGYKQNATLTRTPVREVYNQIISDLEFSEARLNPRYVSATSNSPTTERIRPNQATARALLSRVHISLDNWFEAEKFANLVIDDRELYDTVPLNQVFLKDNKEAIWQLQQPVPRTSEISTNVGNGFVLTTRPNTSAFGCSTISPWLLEAFEPMDQRRSEWVGEFIDNTISPSQKYFFPNKYKIRSASSITEQSTVLRLAEQYLIRAEARLESGNLQGALSDVNIIRKRAKLSTLNIADKDLLHSAIIKERRVELFAEWGHRWFDLKRLGLLSQTMPDVMELKQAEVWNNDMALWPIPEVEIDRNPRLTQNNGYN